MDDSKPNEKLLDITTRMKVLKAGIERLRKSIEKDTTADNAAAANGDRRCQWGTWAVAGRVGLGNTRPACPRPANRALRQLRRQ